VLLLSAAKSTSATSNTYHQLQGEWKEVTVAPAFFKQAGQLNFSGVL